MIGLDKGNPRVRLGALLLAGLAAALAAPLLAGGFDLRLHLGQRLESPSARHLLGTDALGRDMLSSLACGTLVSLAIALIVVILAAGAGLALGYLAGWHGGRLGAAIMHAADFALAFPGLRRIGSLRQVAEDRPAENAVQ